MTGSYITHDGGTTWRMFNLRGVVDFFAFDPKDPNTMYAHATGLWRSTDGGKQWESGLSGSFHGQRRQDGLGPFG